MLRVRDIMTADPVVVTPQTTLREVAELFAARHIGGAPVVDGDKVVGVVAASDVLSFVATTRNELAAEEPTDSVDDQELRTAWDVDDDASARYFAELWTDAGSVTDRLQGAEASEPDQFGEHVVAEVMTEGFHEISLAADVSVAAERMRAMDVHRLLVMDGDVLVGIVTTSDITRAVADRRIVRRTFVFDHATAHRHGRPSRPSATELPDA